ncbi:MAG: hypothetical protein CVU05_11470 [Bacteroidetes bacterium HGW-Bacteroidetes-21]|jgi:hypothetical protein|nr:MAG: hypothetical protein CVU05_11470 [Bacteroidetes bacterium HGW-Bacteroidetes-21]
MKVSGFSLIVFAVFLIACGKGEDKKQQSLASSNVLLPEVLTVEYMVDLDTTDSDSWQKEFVSSEFMPGLREMIRGGKVSVYSPFYDDTSGNRIEVNMIETELGKVTKENSYTWGNYRMYSLGFTERWEFDTVNKSFGKTMLFWRPIFELPSDSVKQSLFNISAGSSDKLLASNMIYELDFRSNHGSYRFLDYKRLYSVLSDMAIKGSIDVFSPGDCNTKLTIETIKERLGESEDLEEVVNEDGLPETKSVKTFYDITELQGIIFIEDWFYSTRSGCFSKKVNGFGPVRYYRDANGNMLKSIPYIFFTGTKKVNVL